MKKIYPDDLAEAIKKSGTKHYRPSNGTEGMDFMELWCEQCEKFQSENEFLEDRDCDILARSFWCDEDDKDYPPEFTYDEGQPCCMAFKEK
jgi:hypothetical protein